MNENPFTSNIFSSIWSKHFNEGKKGIDFNFISGILFYKHHFLPLYINLGKTHSKGMSYNIEQPTLAGYNKKVFLIYDVPSYFGIPKNKKDQEIGFHKIKQYPGFLIELDKFSDLNNYLSFTFSKSSRYKLNKYKKRLEQCFHIKYTMFYGEISKKEYDSVFEHFKTLLEKRFSEKQITNNNLHPKEWNFYHEVAYPMIIEKKAALFVIYDKDQPIGVTLNYFSDQVIFDAITVFDVEYSKFRLGSITIMKLIEWGIETKFKVFDFSKGYFDYKKRWATKTYDFEYHLLYDTTSYKAKSLALVIKIFFEFKQFLRDKNVNEKLHLFTFWLRNIPSKKESITKYEFADLKHKYEQEEQAD